MKTLFDTIKMTGFSIGPPAQSVWAWLIAGNRMRGDLAAYLGDLLI